MRPNKWKAVLIFFFSLLSFCCASAFAQAPTITSISPASGPVSTLVTITGTNFGSTPGSSTVSLSGTSATVVSWSSTTIYALVPAGAATGTFAVKVNGNTANSSSFTVTPLPSGWSDGDIGTVGVSGSASYANGTFTVSGAGSQIYGTSDGFNFAYQSLSGDGTIMARLVSMQGASGFATAGVMIRETLTAGSTNAKTAYWPTYTAIYFDERSSTNGSTSEPGSVSMSLPYWVKVVRSGSTFSSFASTDGANWTQIGASQTISMATGVYMGLAVNSGGTSSVATAKFDNVAISTPSNPSPAITGVSPTSGAAGTQIQISGSGFGTSEGSSVVVLNGQVIAGSSWGNTLITATVPPGAMTGQLAVLVGPNMNASNPVSFSVPLPTPWLDQDIGTVGLTGRAGYGNGAFTVLGAGATGTFSTPDEVHFAYQSLSGDGTIIARLVSLQGGSAAQAGVMIRETLDPSATNLFLFDYSANSFTTVRTSTGGSSSYSDLGGLTPPYWLKMSRSGNTFNTYGSVDGITWSQLGTSQTITMVQNVYIGLAVSNRSASSLATATFDNVSINSAASPAPVITSLSSTTNPIGSQIVIFGSNFGTTQGNSVVTLNGTPLTMDLWTSTAIVVTIPTGATSGPILVSIAPSMNDSNAVYFWVTTQPLPQTWLDQDFNPAGGIGNATYSSATGKFTISGEGAGIGSVGDGMHFVYEPLSGDGTIVARLVSLQGGSSAAQAGVVIRETLSPGASFVGLIYGSTYLNTYERTSTGAGATYQTDVGVTLPYWLKLVRAGNTFTTYASTDGVNWVQEGTSDTVTMAQSVYIGLAVSNNSSTQALATATFDNISISSTANPAPVITSVSATTGSVGSQVVISGNNFGATEGNSVVRLNGALVTLNSWKNTSIIITIPTGATSGPLLVSVAPSMNDSNAVNFTVTSQPLPIPWLDQDVGVVGVVGSGTYTGGTFTVTGAGATGTFSTPDTFHFVYQPLSGDGTIVARVASFTGSSAGQAGVMIRDTLDPSASNADTSYYSSFIFMLDRPTDGGSSSYQQWGNGQVTLPYWVKLVRSGSSFSSYGSADGVTWVQAGTSQTITMGQNAYVGLAVSNRSSTALGTATFDHVSVTVGSTPFVTGAYPALGPVGTSVTVTGSNFGTHGTNTITFNGVAATTVTSWTSTQIVATVPSGTPAGAGPVNVTVNSIAGITNASFTAIEPVVSSVTPPAASINETVTVNGSGFGPNQASSQILFNGVPVAFNTWSDTSIVVNVPPGTTSGPVTVNVDSVVSNGVQFTVLEPLSITGLSTTSGPAGTSVTITGTGFGPTPSNSIASFYGAAATVTSWSDTSITVNVPLGGVSGPVSVEVGSAIIWGPNFTLTSTAQVTDSQSNQTTYKSALLGGTWVPLSSQGSGCTTCTLRGQLSYTYDGNGNMLTRTDELGHVTTYTYDTNGNLLTVTAPIDAHTTAATAYTYNSLGEVLTATDPLGNVTTNTYDANGNLLTVTTPAPSGGGSGSVTAFTYDSKGELLTIKDPLNYTTTITYFSTGLIQTITDAQNNVTTYAYDTHGNRTSVKDALNHTTTFAYDTGDRLKTITYPDTTTTTFTYDTRGRRTSVTDQNSKTTTYAYDDADRLTTVTDAANNVTTYGYDTEDNLTSITDANNHATSFAYDAFGRVTKTTFPSTLFENYAYDAADNLTSKTDRKNQQITYTYDQLNRLTQKSYPDSTTVNYTYDKGSRLTQVTDPTGTYAFTFDNMGRLTNTTTSYAFLTGRNFTTAYGYDAASNRTSFTDPESGATSYVYDTLNRLQTLTPPVAYGGGNFGFTYDALSRRATLTRPNSVGTSYSYDNLSHLLSVTHAKSGTTLDGASYTVDNAGNRSSRTPLPGTTATNYTYDAIYELLTAKQGSTTTESYTYDPVGNRLTSLGVSSYTTNSSNELTAKTGTTYTYDNNGNTLTKVDATGTTTYAWDFENRMSSVTLPGSGGTVSFKYDPFGRRIYKSLSSTTSVYAYDGDNLVEETNATGAVVARYSQTQNIDEPLAMLRSAATSYFHADGLGSVTSLSNAAGSIANTYTYDSFGKLTASTGSLVNPFRYTGREFDTETSLYYYRARYYDQNTGRFLSEDPIWFWGGVNFYSYVRENPVIYRDPSGRKLEDWVPGVHLAKCVIWGYYCGKVMFQKKQEELAHPSTTTPTDDELQHPKDEGKRLIELCAKDDENCKKFLAECGDVVLNPIVKGMFPKP